MSVVLNHRPAAPAARSARNLVSLIVAGAIALALAGYVVIDLLNPSRMHASHGPGQTSAAAVGSTGEAKENAGAASSVSLSESKFKEAKIAIGQASMEKLATEVSVPGMIQANADSRVEVRPRATGIVRTVQATIGQKVKKGQILVVLDSPEVGKARLDLRARQRELATARYEARWKSEIADNVKALIPALEKAIAEDVANRHKDEPVGDRHDEEALHVQGAPARAEALEIRFAGKNLGGYRGTLLQAFADYEIAVHEEVKNVYLQSRDIYGAHQVVLARHTREGMQEKLKGTIEQVRYDAAQQQRLANQALQQAEFALVDAAQRLRILDVPVDVHALLDKPDQGPSTAEIEDVARYDITAPIDGNIVRKFAFAARGQKADANDVLFVVSDLDTVWVKAEVGESDVAKLSRLKDGTFRFRAARAYPGREFQARLISVGSVVDPLTRTVPILAEAQNPDGLLRAEMFTQIILDSSAVEQVLTVPSGAIVEIEGDKFVFVPSDKPRTYSIRPVEAGRQFDGHTVIRAGLNAGEKVVSSGAFFLKSELTFANEPPEE